MYHARIAGTGSYLPEKILTNADLEKMVDTNDQWIRERTGIERRHLAQDGQACSDLAQVASERAIKDAGLTPQDIDFIIVATASGDYPLPTTSCLLQHKLGLRPNVGAIDINAACSGFVYALSVADQFIKTGMYKRILVIGSEVLHHWVNYKDRETCILFGDAAGAFVLERTEDMNDGIFSTHLRAEGSLSELFVVPAGGSKIPLSQGVLDRGDNYVRMRGREIFKHAVRTMSSTCTEALEHNKVQMDEVDWLIPHQANSRIIEAVGEHFGFPKEKVIMTVGETGNTSAATIPVAFDMAKQQGKIKRGQKILLTAFGAGLTAGSALLNY